MKALRNLLDHVGHHFEKGGKLARFFPLFEAVDTFFYTPPDITRTGAHVRDALDLKRMMILVVIAALPCVFMAMYNTGLQANLAIDPAKAAGLVGWRHDVLRLLGVGYSSASIGANVVHGALYFLPLYVVTMVVGLSWEAAFSIIRGHGGINEGFFVTGILFPLILPPTTPLWQAARNETWQDIAVPIVDAFVRVGVRYTLWWQGVQNNTAGRDDIVMVAGKGHEQGQIIGSGDNCRILPLDDVTVARECAA